MDSMRPDKSKVMPPYPPVGSASDPVAKSTDPVAKKSTAKSTAKSTDLAPKSPKSADPVPLGTAIRTPGSIPPPKSPKPVLSLTKSEVAASKPSEPLTVTSAVCTPTSSDDVVSSLVESPPPHLLTPGLESGNIMYPSGDRYEGQWTILKHEQKGAFKFFSARREKSTTVSTKIKEGYGVYSYADGGIYKGQWKNDLRIWGDVARRWVLRRAVEGWENGWNWCVYVQ